MNKTLTWTIILVIILIVISFFFYYSFTGTKIQGLVINSIEQKPISGVSIRINDKYYYTDDEGRFTAYKPIFKPVELIIEKSGFKTVIKKINTKSKIFNIAYYFVFMNICVVFGFFRFLKSLSNFKRRF